MKNIIILSLVVILTGCIAGGELPYTRSKEALEAENYDPKIISSLLNKEVLDYSVFLHLSKHANYNVRSMIASNPNVPQDIVTKLAFDENWLVRLESVCNKNIDEITRNKVLESEKDKNFLTNYKFRQDKN